MKLQLVDVVVDRKSIASARNLVVSLAETGKIAVYPTSREDLVLKADLGQLSITTLEPIIPVPEEGPTEQVVEVDITDFRFL